jgi:hypothetical protein
MHHRPSGVTFSAVVLGIISFFLFFGGLFDVVVAVVFFSNPGIAPSTPGQPAPPQGLMVAMFGLMALLTLACAIWGISTVVGLMRMRRWARISIMIIGGCVTAFSLLYLILTIVVQVAMKNFTPPPNFSNSPTLVGPDANAVQGVFFLMDAFCLGVVAIGVWWLVYFARRRTAEAFARVALTPALSSTAQLNPAMPITDFSVAQPIDPAQPARDVPATPVTSAPGLPVSMIIVAVLLLLGAFSMLVCLFFPYPMFFFGIKFSGLYAHLLLISLAALYALAGVGLLRRMSLGWLLAVGVHLLGLLNLLTMLSPPVRNRWMFFMREAMASTQPLMPTMPGNSPTSVQIMQSKLISELMVPSLIFGVLYVLVMLVLLWRARWAYKTVNKE